MALSPSTLREQLRPIFDPSTMPSSDAVRAWCAAYSSWARDAIAGPVKLAGPLSPIGGSGRFDSALDAAFRSMWMSAVWVGPGVTAITSAVPSLISALSGISLRLITSFDRDLAPSIIAEALHTYTTSIAVTVTPPTGAPFIVPLS